MNYKKHLLIGFVFGVLAIWFLKWASVEMALPFLMFVLVGSLLPDIDHEDSKISRLIRLVAYLVVFLFCIFTYGIIGIVYGIISILLVYIIYIIVKPNHRGFTHTLLFLIIMSAGLFFLFNNVYIAVGYAIGNISHLIADKR